MSPGAANRRSFASSRSEPPGAWPYAATSVAARAMRPLAESVTVTATAYRPGRAAKRRCSDVDAPRACSSSARTGVSHVCDTSSSPAESFTETATRNAPPPDWPIGVTSSNGTRQNTSTTVCADAGR